MSWSDLPIRRAARLVVAGRRGAHAPDARVVLQLRKPNFQGACPTMASTRRLAAILAADVAGYSRLMGADEEGTHERLKAHLGEFVNPKITEHRGRIVKNTGDGFLAEFPSVVDAVRCAMEIQRGMAEREPEVPEERRIRFRIGVVCHERRMSYLRRATVREMKEGPSSSVIRSRSQATASCCGQKPWW